MSNQKPKRSVVDKLINLIAIVILIFFVVNEFSHLYRSLDTINASPELYERHYSVSSTFPFVGSYFLMLPKNYNPKYKYPLVVVLHGVSTHAYAAESLAEEKFRKAYPFFVMVPIAPKRSFWATPKEKTYQMKRNIPYPDHLSQVIAGISDIRSKYEIDASKIIIAGHSMGGSGAIGAMQRYPDIFKAGIASSGSWSPNEISNIKSPLFIFHGTKDQFIPSQLSFELKRSARLHGVPMKVTFLKGRGHGIGGLVYGKAYVWDGVLNSVR